MFLRQKAECKALQYTYKAGGLTPKTSEASLEGQQAFAYGFVLQSALRVRTDKQLPANIVS